MKFRHLAPLAALTMLLPAAAPEGEALIECDTDAEVIVEGESATYDGTAPVLFFPGGGDVPVEDPTGTTTGDIVTVAGSVGETALKTTITAVMTYDVPGDLELIAFDADGNEIGSSTAFNPTDGNVETVTVSVDVCDEVTFSVENYAAPPSTPVSLEVSVEGKRPRVRR